MPPGPRRSMFGSIFFGSSDRRDYDLFDGDTLQISELLTQRVSFSRDPAEDAVCRAQLLHQHVEMAIEGAHRGMLFRVPHRDCGCLLLSLSSLHGTSAAAGVLARHVDGQRGGGC